MVKSGLGIAIAAALAGCAGSPIANERDARMNYERSTADYRACLNSNGANPRACEGKRLVMETDEHHWNNTRERINPSNPIVIQHR